MERIRRECNEDGTRRRRKDEAASPLSLTVSCSLGGTSPTPCRPCVRPRQQGGTVQLTLLDHLRLTFGHVVYRHRAHAHLARSLAQWSRRLRIAEALWMV